MCVDPPKLLAGGKIDCMKHAFRAEGVDAAVSNSRRTARALVKSEIISVCRVVIEPPDAFAIGHVQTLDQFLVAEAMKKNESVLFDNRSAKARADFLFPK